MMKYFIPVITIILIISCNEKKENVLHTKTVDAYFEAPKIDNDSHECSMESIDLNLILEVLKTQTIELNTNIYDSKYFDYGHHLIYPDYNRCEYYLKNNDELKDVKNIFFHEQWELNQDFSKFNKDIKSWTPVKHYERNGEKVKKMAFTVVPSNSNKGGLIGKNIITEMDIIQRDFPKVLGMNYTNFLSTVLRKIEDGSLKAYDPVYFVDNSRYEFSMKDVEAYVHETTRKDTLKVLVNNTIDQYETKVIEESVELKRDLLSLVFLEDWYFDKKSLNIHKEVKALGFARYKYDRKSRIDKPLILFTILFD